MIILMILIHLIILLAVGFGVGYWLLVEATKQEENLKLFGTTLGWILITMTFAITLLGAYYSIKMVKANYIQEEVEEAQEQIRGPQNIPVIQKEDQTEIQEQKTTPTIKRKMKEEIEEDDQEELQEQKPSSLKSEDEIKN